MMKLKIIAFCLLFCATSQSQTLRKIDFKATDIVYSPQQNSLYATAPSTNKAFGNSVCRLDPTTGAVTKSVYVGTEPTCLAVSDDGQYLYVGLEYLPRIIRLKLPEMQVDLTINLMDTSSIYRGSVFAEEIKVLPKNPTSIAVIVGVYRIPSFLHLAVFDNAVRRPIIGYDRIYLSEITAMTFIGKPDTLVAIYPSNDTYIIPITNQGVNNLPLSFDNKTSYYDKYIKYSVRDSLLYTGSNILNPRSNPRLNIVHTFSFSDNPTSKIIAEPDPFAEAIFFSYSTKGKLLLKRYNTNTKLLTQEWTLSDIEDELPQQIINLGKAEKIATLSSNAIYLLDNKCVSTISEIPTIVQGYTATFCPDSSVILSVNTNNKVLWSTGDTTTAIKVQTAGKYTVAFLDQEGCMSYPSAPIIVTQTAATNAPYIFPLDPTINRNREIVLCQGQNLVLRANNFDGSPLKWNTGSTNPFLTVTQSGNYYVTSVNSAGCQMRSSIISVSYRPQQAPPKPILSVIGKTDLCNFDEQVTLQAPTSYKSYFWTNGATTPNITVSPYNQDSFAVKVTNTEGCSSDLSDFIKVRKIQPIPKPILLYQDSILQSINTFPYQHRWFRNGELIAPNTLSFKPISAGFYTVQAYNGQCNSPFSDWINILLPIKSGIEQLAQSGFIQVFPNPTEGLIRVQIISDMHGGTVELYDNTGKRLKTEIIKNADNQLDISLSSLSNGSYILVWKSADGTARGLKKVVKLL